MIQSRRDAIERTNDIIRAINDISTYLGEGQRSLQSLLAITRISAMELRASITNNALCEGVKVELGNGGWTSWREVKFEEGMVLERRGNTVNAGRTIRITRVEDGQIRFVYLGRHGGWRDKEHTLLPTSMRKDAYEFRAVAA